MAFLFSRTKPSGTAAVVQAAKLQLEQIIETQSLPATTTGMPPTKEEPAFKALGAIKSMIQGSYDEDPKPEKVHELVNNMITNDIFFILARSMRYLNFAGRKDAQTIFSYAFRFRPANSTSEETPAIEYVINKRPEVIVELCRGYEHKESATPCGTVLREILKHESVTAIVLYDESKPGEPAVKSPEIDLNVRQTGEGVFWKFFDWIHRGAFEASADAYTTFRDILSRHRPLVAHYLHLNFDLFFDRYHRILINSNSYVTKRQSIKLLGELLLDRTNYNVMTEYVDKGDHLKISMNLLRDERKMVQYEGFHVFKVFVANPHKSEAVTKILRNNRERLLNFLPTFLDDRMDDDQFSDEKAFLIRSIDSLPTMLSGNGPNTANVAPP